jgi:ATP phosphoribosyltransferase
VAEGLFDLGITGRDWVEETAHGGKPGSWLLQGDQQPDPGRRGGGRRRDVKRVDDLPNGVRVSTEYPELTRRFFESRGVEADIRLSYGASEAKIPDIADCIVDITETGRALRAAGLRILDTILVSHTELVANPAAAADPVKRHAMGQLLTLLQGALEARGKVLVKLNVAEADRERVLALVPSMKSPTVSPLAGGGFAVETVVEKRTINTLIPDLKDAGATDILELPLSKIVH